MKSLSSYLFLGLFGIIILLAYYFLYYAPHHTPLAIFEDNFMKDCNTLNSKMDRSDWNRICNCTMLTIEQNFNLSPDVSLEANLNMEKNYQTTMNPDNAPIEWSMAMGDPGTKQCVLNAIKK